MRNHQLSSLTFVTPIVWLCVPVLLTFGLHTWGAGCELRSQAEETMACSHARTHLIYSLACSKMFSQCHQCQSKLLCVL